MGHGGRLGSRRSPVASRSVAPLISVVMATFDRSDVLGAAIDSVRAQTDPCWEVVVVGDACTDDTEAAVAAYDDERIRFVSLGRNFGEQSGPNTVGTLLAAGELIAYLNHDDLWFPDHLAVARGALERTGADGVLTRVAALLPASPEDLEADRWRAHLWGHDVERRYRPPAYAPASCWVLRREVVETVGGWRPARSLRAESSQDLLFRATGPGRGRAGFHLRQIPDVTVIAFQSGVRRNSYIGSSHEHPHFAARLAADPSRLRRELSARARDEGGADPPTTTLRGAARAAATTCVDRLLALAGVDPKSARYRLRGRARGAQARELRRRRGLT